MVSARSICFVDSFDGFVHFELWFVEKRLFQLYSYVLDEERHGKMLEIHESVKRKSVCGYQGNERDRPETRRQLL